MKREHKVISEKTLDNLTKGGIAVCLAGLIGVTTVFGIGSDDKTKCYGAYHSVSTDVQGAEYAVSQEKDIKLNMPIGWNLKANQVYRNIFNKSLEDFKSKTVKVNRQNEENPCKVSCYDENGRCLVTVYRVEPAAKVTIDIYNADGTPAKGDSYYIASSEGGIVVGDKCYVADKEYVVTDETGEYEVFQKRTDVIRASVTTKITNYSDGKPARSEKTYFVPEGFTLRGDMGYRESLVKIEDEKLKEYLIEKVIIYNAGLKDGDTLKLEKRSK